MTATSKIIVLATNNQGKLNELKTLFSATQLEFRAQNEYQVPEAEETGSTFIENALIKARNACKYSGLPSIADDSGLEVDCLDGAPGVNSSRFAGENATDSDNLNKLLKAVQKFPAEKRTARFHCVMTYLRWEKDPAPLISSCTWEGRITKTPRGQHGFGYDPIFFLTSHNKTSAELDIEEKNLLSHRGQALRNLTKQIDNQILSEK
ncbi:MAG: non-canonical purine NTP pyrophosphatase, RdgB/HAM1 family [Gammaproteobacteria bacterium]|nr:non-canonical purine NTP pyrophosphatase, RdgB/HAM1 family [Gammaproteobacteria bacterium]|tara:strand:- start:1381 stop:2001 length:621 start_codon:yes stop_codon:yes gene_type:complete